MKLYPVLPFLFLMGCSKKIDRLAIDRILKYGMTSTDLEEGCAFGESMAIPLGAASRKLPNKAMVIAETDAAMCSQMKAFELELNAEHLQVTIPIEHPHRIAKIKDARLESERVHAKAASRFYNAYQFLEAEYGTLGEACPNIAKKDESIFVIGLVAGTLSVLHDKSSGSKVGIPLDTLNKIARATSCVSDESWWHVPMAVQGSIWATIPGSGPGDIDPWVHLKTGAKKGEASGVRVGWAMHNLIAENSGQTERLKEGIEAHAEALSIPQNPDWAFLDAYGLKISQHQLDLIWIREKGHRAPTFGELPIVQEQLKAPADDPFGADPFGDTKENDNSGGSMENSE